MATRKLAQKAKAKARAKEPVLPTRRSVRVAKQLQKKRGIKSPKSPGSDVTSKVNDILANVEEDLAKPDNDDQPTFGYKGPHQKQTTDVIWFPPRKGLGWSKFTISAETGICDAKREGTAPKHIMEGFLKSLDKNHVMSRSITYDFALDQHGRKLDLPITIVLGPKAAPLAKEIAKNTAKGWSRGWNPFHYVNWRPVEVEEDFTEPEHEDQRTFGYKGPNQKETIDVIWLLPRRGNGWRRCAISSRTSNWEITADIRPPTKIIDGFYRSEEDRSVLPPTEQYEFALDHDGRELTLPITMVLGPEADRAPRFLADKAANGKLKAWHPFRYVEWRPGNVEEELSSKPEHGNQRTFGFQGPWREETTDVIWFPPKGDHGFLRCEISSRTGDYDFQAVDLRPPNHIIAGFEEAEEARSALHPLQRYNYALDQGGRELRLPIVIVLGPNAGDIAEELASREASGNVQEWHPFRYVKWHFPGKVKDALVDTSLLPGPSNGDSSVKYGESFQPTLGYKGPAQRRPYADEVWLPPTLGRRGFVRQSINSTSGVVSSERNSRPTNEVLMGYDRAMAFRRALPASKRTNFALTSDGQELSLPITVFLGPKASDIIEKQERRPLEYPYRFVKWHELAQFEHDRELAVRRSSNPPTPSKWEAETKKQTALWAEQDFADKAQAAVKGLKDQLSPPGFSQWRHVADMDHERRPGYPQEDDWYEALTKIGLTAAKEHSNYTFSRHGDKSFSVTSNWHGRSHIKHDALWHFAKVVGAKCIGQTPAPGTTSCKLHDEVATPTFVPISGVKFARKDRNKRRKSPVRRALWT